MRKLAIVLFLLLVGEVSAQDYVVEEKFTPSTFSPKKVKVSTNHRAVNAWGLNTPFADSEENTEIWGSNLFSLKYQFVKPLYKGFSWNYAIGYNWNNFKLKNKNEVLLHDSVFHDYRKLRVQSASLETGFRLQSKIYPKKAWFIQVNAYVNIKTYTKYMVEDKVGNMQVETDTKKLDYVAPFHYGTEVRVGKGMFSFFGKYRLSDMFKESVNYSEMPVLSLGIALESWD